MNTYKFLTIFVFILLNVFVFSQETLYSYYNYTPFFFNPGVCGNHYESGVLHLNHSQQWSSFSDPTYKTSSFSFEKQLHNSTKKKKKCDNPFSDCFAYNKNVFSIGLGFTSQKLSPGEMKTNTGLLCLAYTKTVGEEVKYYYSLGASLGWSFMSIDYSDLQFLSQWNSNTLTFQHILPSDLANGSNTSNYPDFSMGIEVGHKGRMKGRNYKNLTLGIAALHLNQPNMTFIASQKSDIRINVNGSYRMVYDRVAIEPKLYYSVYGQANQLVFGTNFDVRVDCDDFRDFNEDRDYQFQNLYILSSLKVRATPVRDIIVSVGLRYKIIAFYLSYCMGFESHYQFEGRDAMQMESLVLLR